MAGPGRAARALLIGYGTLREGAMARGAECLGRDLGGYCCSGSRVSEIELMHQRSSVGVG
jgi:hypothetical protein